MRRLSSPLQLAARLRRFAARFTALRALRAAHPPTDKGPAMSPLSATQTELSICIAHIVKRHDRISGRELPAGHCDWEDHRTEAMADLTEAVDRIEPGLGSRLFMALYPRANCIGRGLAS